MYLENLPSAAMYEKSYMHRDVLSFVSCTRYDLRDLVGWSLFNARLGGGVVLVSLCMNAFLNIL